MIGSSKALATCALMAALAAGGCSTRRPPNTVPTSEPSPIAVYRARLDDGAEGQRRFRIWLYAELPDRFHGEIISPVGTTELIVDAGDGRMAVAFVRDRVAFVGAADPAVLEGLMGIRAGLDDLVRALLVDGAQLAGYRVERGSGVHGGLPDRLSIESSQRTLTLELKRRQGLPGEASALGRGLAPPGMTEHPLDQLDLTAMTDQDEAGSP